MPRRARNPSCETEQTKTEETLQSNQINNKIEINTENYWQSSSLNLLQDLL